MLVDPRAIANWIQSLRVSDAEGGYAYRHSVGSDYSPFSSCFAALTLSLVGGLENFSDYEKRGWADYLRGLQDERTGCFDPGDVDLTGKAHDRDYVTWHLTTFCLAALLELGHEPRFPFSAVSQWHGRDRVRTWLSGLKWRDPWCAGNLVMFVCIMLLWEAERRGDEKSRQAVEDILDWHDEQQRPASGFWGRGRRSDFLEGFGGALHQFLIYFYVGRPINRGRRIVDRVLRLQQRDGLFTPRMGGDGCADYDAIDLLVKMSRHDDYRIEDIRRALRRAYEGLQAVRHPSGGFLWNNPHTFVWPDWLRHACMLGSFSNWVYVNRQLLAARLHKGRRRYSDGWTVAGMPQEEPDLFATFMRILSVYLIAEVVDVPETHEPRRFLKGPGLGWHHPTRRAEAEGAR